MKRTAACIFLAGLLAAPALAGPVAAGPAGFDRAPDLDLTDTGGQRRRIDYKSARVTLVNFWATWCLPCREEMPMIASLHKKLGPRGLQAVGIAVESGGPGEIKEFLDKNRSFGISYTILVGGDETLTRFGDVEIVPTTYLFDSSGKLLKSWFGVTPNFEQTVEAEVGRHLSEGNPSPANPPGRSSGGR